MNLLDSLLKQCASASHGSVLLGSGAHRRARYRRPSARARGAPVPPLRRGLLLVRSSFHAASISCSTICTRWRPGCRSRLKSSCAWRRARFPICWRCSAACPAWANSRTHYRVIAAAIRCRLDDPQRLPEPTRAALAALLEELPNAERSAERLLADFERQAGIASALGRRNGFRFPLRQAAQAAAHRLRRRRRGRRPRLLRSARVGGALGRVSGHRQGRHPARSLVPPGPPPHFVPRPSRAGFVVGHDVRIPHARAVHEDVPQHAARPERRSRDRHSAALCARARRAVGNLRSRLRPARSCVALPVPRLRYSGAGRQLEAFRQPGDRAVCNHVGRHGGPRRGRRESAPHGRLRLDGKVRILRIGGLFERRAAGGTGPRAHGASPGYGPHRAGEHAAGRRRCASVSTPTPWCRRPNICCRSGWPP